MFEDPFYLETLLRQLRWLVTFLSYLHHLKTLITLDCRTFIPNLKALHIKTYRQTSCRRDTRPASHQISAAGNGAPSGEAAAIQPYNKGSFNWHMEQRSTLAPPFS